MTTAPSKERQPGRWWVTIAFMAGTAIFSAGGAIMALQKDIADCKDQDSVPQEILTAIRNNLSQLLVTTRDIEATRQVNDKQDASIDSIRKDMMDMNAWLTGRIHTLDISVAGINEQLKAIRAMQERIERSIEKMANGRAKEMGVETGHNGAQLRDHEQNDSMTEAGRWHSRVFR